MEIIREDIKDVAEPDRIVSGTAGTGHENNELEWSKRHEKKEEKIASKPVERRTGLRGQGIGPVQRPGRAIRTRTEQDLLAYDSDIPYAAVEQANRDLICSLIERQDRVTEQLLLMINDLQYRLDDLEYRVGGLRYRTGDFKSLRRAFAIKRPGTGREVRE